MCLKCYKGYNHLIKTMTSKAAIIYGNVVITPQTSLKHFEVIVYVNSFLCALVDFSITFNCLVGRFCGWLQSESQFPVQSCFVFYVLLWTLKAYSGIISATLQFTLITIDIKNPFK